jgi:hypothetical protein
LCPLVFFITMVWSVCIALSTHLMHPSCFFCTSHFSSILLIGQF